jgi:hypothetical protein
MADYSLESLGAKFTEYGGKRLGMLIPCPNCGVNVGVYFAPLSEDFKANFGDKGPTWTATGDTLNAVTLHPSVRVLGHFHSWVRNGMLCVDSPFECKKDEEFK